MILIVSVCRYIACGRKDENRDTAVDGLRIATLKVMQDEQA